MSCLFSVSGFSLAWNVKVCGCFLILSSNFSSLYVMVAVVLFTDFGASSSLEIMSVISVESSVCVT